MKLSIVCCLAFIAIVVGEIWKSKVLKSKWMLQTLIVSQDTDTIFRGTTTVVAKSTTVCANSCSKLVEFPPINMLYIQSTGNCYCKLDNFTMTPIADNSLIAVYGIQKTVAQVDVDSYQHTRTTVWPFKPNCLSLYENYYRANGVYVISPSDNLVTETWCDMADGGWTVIQRRFDGSENFNRGRDDYIAGFGKRTGEFWLGLDAMHHLTKNGSELSIYLEAYPDEEPTSMFANYSEFIVSDGHIAYAVDMRGFTGTCGDSFSYHWGYLFSTYDLDYERTNCPVVNGGGWWYRGSDCHRANLNGIYYKQGEYALNTGGNRSGIHWSTCWHYKQSSKTTVMKIR